MCDLTLVQVETTSNHRTVQSLSHGGVTRVHCAHADAMQVETTSNQAVLRVLSTALGCVLGWALLSSPHSATEPVLVSAFYLQAPAWPCRTESFQPQYARWVHPAASPVSRCANNCMAGVCACTACPLHVCMCMCMCVCVCIHGLSVQVGAVIIITITLLTPITRTQFKLLAYVTSTTIASVTACQVSVAGCCSSDFTGSNRYALERFISECLSTPSHVGSKNRTLACLLRKDA